VSSTPGSITGGAGTDTFDFTNASNLNTASATVAAAGMYTITDFKAGPLFAETIGVDAAHSGAGAVTYYAEKSATTFANAVTTAIATMTDPTTHSDIVAVQVGSDTYVFVDQDGGGNIDAVIKLVGVGTNVLNFADFVVS
jgi:hypothetical protein